MSLQIYSRVRLITDKYRDQGVYLGQQGYIIEVYGGDAYEVEFSDAQGITIAQVVVSSYDVELDEPSLQE